MHISTTNKNMSAVLDHAMPPSSTYTKTNGKTYHITVVEVVNQEYTFPTLFSPGQQHIPARRSSRTFSKVVYDALITRSLTENQVRDDMIDPGQGTTKHKIKPFRRKVPLSGQTVPVPKRTTSLTSRPMSRDHPGRASVQSRRHQLFSSIDNMLALDQEPPLRGLY